MNLGKGAHSTHCRGRCHSKLSIHSTSINRFGSMLYRNSVNMVNPPNDPRDRDCVLYMHFRHSFKFPLRAWQTKIITKCTPTAKHLVSTDEAFFKKMQHVHAHLHARP